MSGVVGQKSVLSRSVMFLRRSEVVALFLTSLLSQKGSEPGRRAPSEGVQLIEVRTSLFEYPTEALYAETPR